jgi:sirohydrochlorin cobaltochelatase
MNSNASTFIRGRGSEYIFILVSAASLPYGSCVSADAFADSSVLLIAHGSTVNADSARSAFGHAERLREPGYFRAVTAAFWKQAPFIRDALAELHSEQLFIVPLFLSDGYFTRQVLPRELELPIKEDGSFSRIASCGAQRLFYCEPIGTSPVMTDVILARVEEVLTNSSRGPGTSDKALVLAAHGTEKDSQSSRAAEWHIQRIRATGRFAEAHAAFMEESPRISDLAAFTKTKDIVVVPFFISEGLHAREDVPVLLGESPDEVQRRLKAGQPTFSNPTERHGKRMWYAASIGTAPLVRDVILQRIREAAKWKA